VASLYNPYWQVSLTQPSSASLTAVCRSDLGFNTVFAIQWHELEQAVMGDVMMIPTALKPGWEWTRRAIEQLSRRRAAWLGCALFAGACTVSAQQNGDRWQMPGLPADLQPSPSEAWTGPIMDNIVVRYRRVLLHPEVADRIVALLNEAYAPLGCPFPLGFAEDLRRRLSDYEETRYLNGTSVRTEKRFVSVDRASGTTCTDAPRLKISFTIDIRTPESNILYTRSEPGGAKVSVWRPPPDVASAVRMDAQRRLRDARNIRTVTGRSMGRVWRETETINGFVCGRTRVGADSVCTLVEQPMHVASRTPLSVEVGRRRPDPECAQPSGDNARNFAFLLGCAVDFKLEMTHFQGNARIPANTFDMPVEARELPIQNTELPEADLENPRGNR